MERTGKRSANNDNYSRRPRAPRGRRPGVMTHGGIVLPTRRSTIRLGWLRRDDRLYFHLCARLIFTTVTETGVDGVNLKKYWRNRRRTTTTHEREEGTCRCETMHADWKGEWVSRFVAVVLVAARGRGRAGRPVERSILVRSRWHFDFQTTFPTHRNLLGCFGLVPRRNFGRRTRVGLRLGISEAFEVC